MSPLPQMWCPRCGEWTVLIDSGWCPWCSGRLEDEHGRPAAQPPRLRGLARHIPEDEILAAHREHMDGVSVSAIAEAAFHVWGYASGRSAQSALLLEFRKHGLPVRVRGTLDHGEVAA